MRWRNSSGAGAFANTARWAGEGIPIMAKTITSSEGERLFVRAIAMVEIVYFTWLFWDPWWFANALFVGIFVLAAVLWKSYDPTAGFGKRTRFFAGWAGVQSIAIPITSFVGAWHMEGTAFDDVFWNTVLNLFLSCFAMLWLVKLCVAIPLWRLLARLIPYASRFYRK